MNTVRYIRTIIILLALMMGGTSEVWAQEPTEPTLTAANIVIVEGIEHGTVAVRSVDAQTRTVTLTITPSAGYCIQKSDIVVQKLADPAVAGAPRRAPGIADPLIITDGPAKSKSAAEYTFVVPEDYAGAMVTVTFRQLAAAIVPVTAKTLVYTGSAQELITLGEVVGCVATDPVTYSLSENGTYTTAIPTGTDADTYTVYYKYVADGDHADGSGSVRVTINKAPITSVELVDYVKKKTGSAISFSIKSVKAGDVTVSSDDYVVSGDDLTTQNEVGTYTCTVTAKPASTTFTGSASVNFRIVETTTVFIPEDDDSPSDLAGKYVLTEDITASVLTGLYNTSADFTGELDGNFHKITGVGGSGEDNHGLFNTINGGVVKNVIIEDVSISSGANVGAIANEAIGDTRIYNCGILEGSVGGSDYVGGLVGLLEGKARVINCYSYATITSGSNVGGIVGYNNATTTAASINTMVMNCMFYGDISGGTIVSPIYGGTNINNLNSGGLNTFNYYAYDKLKSSTINAYNCALAADEKYLTRIEFYRLLLNSNKKLAAYYATGSANNANQMAKWVLETADRQISTPKPYPILKAQGIYPSIVNIDAENAPSTTERNKGGRIGTLNVSISESNTTSGGQTKPTGATVETTSLTLVRTDKDEDRFNFNYDKVQLPYYNDVGTKNYTGNKVVTGWKITGITTLAGDPYTSSNYDYSKTYADNPEYFDYPNYNFADRKSSQKDLYSVSGRVFSQGAYFDVPYGVTSITIEPYWGKAAYVSDEYFDVVNKVNSSGNNYEAQSVTQLGRVYGSNGTSVDIKGSSQKVYTSISNALSNLSGVGTPTVYDYAVVLVGNLHQNGVPSGQDKPFTMMSVDLDNDHEPDYSMIYHHNSRATLSPIRFDFLNIPGTAHAQKPNEAAIILNAAIFRTKGWFEITNTSAIYFTQYEYENTGTSDKPEQITKISAPLILLGGYIDQFVSAQSAPLLGKTIYIHVGSNVLINSFGLGTHSDGSGVTQHVPVSVTGGEYNGFYLSGTYNQDAVPCDDNAECYISGGRFGELAGAAQEQIGSTNSASKGNVTWQIYDADITDFYGGGVNDAKPVQGNITTRIYNSHVTTFCGGPKFGNMASDRTVTTNAEGCTFDRFFGAGFGGNSYSRKKYFDNNVGINWNTLQGYYTTDKGKYFNGVTTNSRDGGTGNSQYGKKGPGVATDFDYELFVWTSGKTGVRYFVKFVSFSLAQCNDVNSTLKECTINDNFYGGGNLGKVAGIATSSLEDCTVKGNVFGAGYSASLPKIRVREGGLTKLPNINSSSGMFEPGVPAMPTSDDLSGTIEYEWTYKGSYPSNGNVGFIGNDGNYNINGNKVVTTQNITNTNLGTVGSVDLTIKGTTTVGGSVYGGGEESGVDGDTEVNVTGGTIGTQGNGGVEYGNVYGGGKGKRDNVTAGLVKGNTKVTIENTKDGNGETILYSPTIYHNVYGGGAYGSVGDFDYDATTGLPTGLKTGAAENSGKTEVYIKGGTFGWNGQENGMIFGSSRGDVGAPGSIEDKLAWVYDTHVAIGDTATNATITTAAPIIKGSIYGGGENGHNLRNSYVRINGGTVGVITGDNVVVTNADNSTTTYAAYNYPYRGNVYGGGCGTDTYIDTNDGNKKKYNSLAGVVKGNAFVNITGGHVVHNVYGAGAMGSVGTDVVGAKTKVNISGGRIGYDGERNGNVFGAARGEYGISTAASGFANVRESEVNISYATTPAGDNTAKTAQLIAGSVFGGGEAGTVKGSVAVNMTGGLILKDLYGGGALADTQTSNWDATNNTWATGKTSESATTTVRLTGGTIRGEAFGGGLGEAGKPAYVYGNVLLDLNGTTTPGGTTGTAIDEKARGCAVGEVFGCNNVNGTPKGTATVHVYATQNASKLQIANKTKDDYDVTAVYGGGNMAAYEPADLANGSTNVIIDGCALTSIKTVYGGGNAASTPATSVTVNGTYEIEEVFGGGNGKDALPDGSPNPGANVGFRDYSAVESTYPTKEDRQNDDFTNNYVYGTGKASVNIFGGTIHRVFGGSNTKGNVRKTAVTLLEEANSCDFCVDEAYGGGKSAPMDAEAKLLMACIPGLKVAYGGAEAADVQGDVTLNITNGTFDRVFGGNNISGTIHGTITVNVEEIGCKPVIIGQLYGGGNQAAYTAPSGKDGPTVNVRSFTSIGEIYGGGYGKTATVTGDCYVNIDEIEGKYASDAYDEKTKTITFTEYKRTADGGFELDADGKRISEEKTVDVVLPGHDANKIGAINNVFGGGNEAKVLGSTNVNIGTKMGESKFVEVAVGIGTDVSKYYKLTDTGTTEDPYKYVAGATNDPEGTKYYKKETIKGVDIRGNVYGGGNNAEVTGNTNVTIGKEAATTSGSTQNP